ncbi:MAG: sulfite exporter TauE/SafE family protein [Desulfobulbus sp.]
MTWVELGASGMMLGLATGPVCLVSCAPVFLPLVASGKEAARHSGYYRQALLRFLAGRGLAYGLTGLLVARAGGYSEQILPAISAWATLVLAWLLVGSAWGWSLGFGCRSCAGGRGNSMFWAGMLTGLSPCVPFLLAIAQIWQNGWQPLAGGLFFLGFFGGTSLYLLPLAFGGSVYRTPFFPGLRRVVAGGAGLVFLYKGSVALLG